MCVEMEYNEVKDLIDLSLEPVKNDLDDIKKMTQGIPGLLERLTNYKNIEKKVTEHDFILCGANGKPSMVDKIITDVENLKSQGKKVFNLIVKIAAFTGTALGIFLTIKTLFF